MGLSSVVPEVSFVGSHRAPGPVGGRSVVESTPEQDETPISPRRAFRAALEAQAAKEEQEARAVLAERAAQAALALTSPADEAPAQQTPRPMTLQRLPLADVIPLTRRELRGSPHSASPRS
jgi:hypothetical protein